MTERAEKGQFLKVSKNQPNKQVPKSLYLLQVRSIIQKPSFLSITKFIYCSTWVNSIDLMTSHIMLIKIVLLKVVLGILEWHQILMIKRVEYYIVKLLVQFESFHAFYSHIFLVLSTSRMSTKITELLSPFTQTLCT